MYSVVYLVYVYVCVQCMNMATVVHMSLIGNCCVHILCLLQVKNQAPQVVLASRMLFENPDSEVCNVRTWCTMYIMCVFECERIFNPLTVVCYAILGS